MRLRTDGIGHTKQPALAKANPAVQERLGLFGTLDALGDRFGPEVRCNSRDTGNQHGDAYARIISVIKNADGDFRQLDLKDATVRSALANVRTKEDIEQVFSQHGAAYA